MTCDCESASSQAAGWPRPPADWATALAAEPPTADGCAVHVWALRLDLDATALTAFSQSLSPEELARAGRFHFELHRNRFIVARGQTRAILARYLGRPADELEFGQGPFGKPFLRAPETGLQFNLSHSEGLGLLAVSASCPLGADVEAVRPLVEAGELVARFFSKRESAAFNRLPSEEQAVAFFNLWTRKEAWLKATGEGIAHSLHLVEVSFLPGEPAQLLSVPPHLAGGRHWSLQPVAPLPGFAAAVAVAAKQPHLQCWQWDTDG